MYDGNVVEEVLTLESEKWMEARGKMYDSCDSSPLQNHLPGEISEPKGDLRHAKIDFLV